MKKLAKEAGISTGAFAVTYLVIAGTAYLLGFYPGQPTKTFGSTPNVDPAVINAYLAQWGGAIVLVAVTLYRNISPAWQAVVMSICNIIVQFQAKAKLAPAPAPVKPDVPPTAAELRSLFTKYDALHTTIHDIIAKLDKLQPTTTVAA